VCCGDAHLYVSMCVSVLRGRIVQMGMASISTIPAIRKHQSKPHTCTHARHGAEQSNLCLSQPTGSKQNQIPGAWDAAQNRRVLHLDPEPPVLSVPPVPPVPPAPPAPCQACRLPELLPPPDDDTAWTLRSTVGLAGAIALCRRCWLGLQLRVDSAAMMR
jgi:hypothetical protein